MKPQKIARALFVATALITASLPMHAIAAADNETAGQYVDDSVITTKVKAAIIADKSLSAAEINVETYKGVVQLSGFVKDPTAVGKAGEVARNVKGVQSVKNDIRVK